MQRVAVSEPGAVATGSPLHNLVVIFHCVYFFSVDPVATAPGSDIERPLIAFLEDATPTSRGCDKSLAAFRTQGFKANAPTPCGLRPSPIIGSN